MKLELINRTRSELLFGKIRTRAQVKRRLGIIPDRMDDEDITVAEFNRWIGALQAKQNTKEQNENCTNTSNTKVINNPITKRPPTVTSTQDKQFDCRLFEFQKRAALSVYSALQSGKKGFVLQADTGLGKTFIAGQFISWIVKEKWTAGKSWSPFPILWLTKASIVEETVRKLENYFGFNKKEKGDLVSNGILVTNYDQLRSKAGSLYLKQEEFYQDGEYHRRYVWHQGMSPALIVADECQALKNASTQSDILQAYSNLDCEQWPRFMLAMSATLWVTVANAKSVLCNMHMPFEKHNETKHQTITL